MEVDKFSPQRLPLGLRQKSVYKLLHHPQKPKIFSILISISLDYLK